MAVCRVHIQRCEITNGPGVDPQGACAARCRLAAICHGFAPLNMHGFFHAMCAVVAGERRKSHLRPRWTGDVIFWPRRECCRAGFGAARGFLARLQPGVVTELTFLCEFPANLSEA